VEPVSGGDRRIDHVLDQAFVAGLDTLSLDELRRRRDDAEQEEADASYLRRLLQGRLDIIRAELERRAEQGANERDLSDLLTRLPAILAGADAGQFNAVPRVLVPPRADQHRRRVEKLVSDETLARLSELDDGELATVIDTLVAEERRVSQTRRAVQEVLDQLRGELTRRYRDGGADVSALLETEGGHREH
jgi:anti-sigma-K factor RsiG